MVANLRTVVVVGPTQCGSTRVFNTARLIGEVAGLSVRAHWDIKAHPASPNYAIDVAKVHNEYGGARLRRHFDVVILPVRDLRDAALSALTRKFIERDGIVRFCARQAHCVNRLAPFATLVLRYETFNAHTVRRIARSMCVRLDDAQVNLVLRRLDVLYRSPDLPVVDDRTCAVYNRTLMSQAHNTAGGRSNKWRVGLTSHELRAIRRHPLIARYLKQFNYALS